MAIFMIVSKKTFHNLWCEMGLLSLLMCVFVYLRAYSTKRFFKIKQHVINFYSNKSF